MMKRKNLSCKFNIMAMTKWFAKLEFKPSHYPSPSTSLATEWARPPRPSSNTEWVKFTSLRTTGGAFASSVRWVPGKTKRINAFPMAGSWRTAVERESGWDNALAGIRWCSFGGSLRFVMGSTWNLPVDSLSGTKHSWSRSFSTSGQWSHPLWALGTCPLVFQQFHF